MGFELSSIDMLEQRAWETGSAEPEAHQKGRVSDRGNFPSIHADPTLIWTTCESHSPD